MGSCSAVDIYALTFRPRCSLFALVLVAILAVRLDIKSSLTGLVLLEAGERHSSVVWLLLAEYSEL
jgi:hypothetical protein